MNGRGYIGPALLEVRLVCSECGAPLQMKGGVQIEGGSSEHEIGPRRTFHIVPCKGCIEAETGPAKALKAAIDGLSKLP